MVKKEYNIINQQVGKINKRVYLTDRKPEHFMRKYHGFGISVNIINDLISEGVDIVIISYYGTKGLIRYRVTLEKFINSEKEYTDIRFGEDPQKFVDINDMEVV